MTIDGVDSLTEYGVEQWNVTPAYSEMANNSEWVKEAIEPTMLNTTIGFKKMKVAVIIRGDSRQDIWRKGSRLIATLLHPRVLTLDGFHNKFMMVLKNASQAESSIKRWHKATLEFNGYEFGDEIKEQFSNLKTFTIINPGDLDAPCSIEILPVIGKTNLVITGLVRNRKIDEDKPIQISGLTNGKTIFIDCETGLITENGINKFPDVEIWEMPSLLPGENVITLNQSDIDFTIKYKPRYL